MDLFTFSHFLLGFFGILVIFPSDPINSFLVINIVHLFLEIVENAKDPNGKVLEPCYDHYNDQLAFTLGSIVAIILGINIQNQPTVYCIVLMLWVFSFIQEIGRELFPKHWPINPAYGHLRK